MDYARAFQNLNLPPRQYIIRTGAPMVLLGLGLAVVLFLFAGNVLFGILRFIVPLVVFGGACGGAAMYPLAAADRLRVQIDNALPFFMTHFGVLSTSNIPRTEMLRLLSLKREYGALARELERIHSLVEDWNMALPEACRFVSRSTSSRIFSEFLERLAHAMETGQELEPFLRNEQSVVMKEYATLYETAIYQIETWKEIYISVILSGAFFTLFAIITPILTGSSPEGLLLGVLAFLLFMEVLLLMVLRLRLPADKLVHGLDIRTSEDRRRRLFLLWSVAVSAVLVVGLVAFAPWDVAISFALGVSPMAVSGWMANRAEELIKKREDNYAAFIRSLGASQAARGGSSREVLKQVKAHNFGPLSAVVHNLYARLTWRLDDPAAWKYFSAESGSYVVDAFTDMFREGIRTGGKPDRIGEIISDNVVRILNLRKSRYSTAGTFRGILIGITASMAFVMFSGIAILSILGELFTSTSTEVDPELAPVQLDFDVNIALVTLLMVVLLAVHSLMASIMLKMVDGGGFAAGLGVFVVMMWLSAVLLVLSQRVLPRVLQLGG